MNRVLGEKGIHLAKQYRAKGMGLKEAVAKARIALLRPHQSVGIEEKHRITSVLNCFFCTNRRTERITFFRMRLHKTKYIPGAAISAPVCHKHRRCLEDPGLNLRCQHDGEVYRGFTKEVV